MSTRVFSISVFRPVLPLLQPEPWVSKPEPGDPFGLLGYYYLLPPARIRRRKTTRVPWGTAYLFETIKVW
jgi:hypothetical protein